MSLIKLVKLAVFSDSRGELVSLESGRNVPFDIRRVYYLYGTNSGVARGFHAHRALKQVAIAVHGSCRFVLDNGMAREEVILSDPSQGLLVDSFIWREMHDFSDDCVLMVLANQPYDENDYIRDYDDFLKMSIV